MEALSVYGNVENPNFDKLYELSHKLQYHLAYESSLKGNFKYKASFRKSVSEFTKLPEYMPYWRKLDDPEQNEDEFDRKIRKERMTNASMKIKGYLTQILQI